jgi:hypothetical protein
LALFASQRQNQPFVTTRSVYLLQQGQKTGIFAKNNSHI